MKITMQCDTRKIAVESASTLTIRSMSTIGVLDQLSATPVHLIGVGPTRYSLDGTHEPFRQFALHHVFIHQPQDPLRHVGVR
jgi:hypothetical protein